MLQINGGNKMITFNLQLFGGRGAGSGGGVGPHGAGMENGNSTTTVKDSHNLTEEIGQGGGKFANEIMNTRDNLETEYGDAVKNLTLQAATFSDPSTLGAYGGNTLYMNEKYIKNKNLTEAMQESVKSGFHPGLGNKTGAEAVASHEIGHRLGEVAAGKAGITEKDIVARAAKKTGIKTENMAGHISGYARTNYSETIAEAVSDVYCNGKKASKASKAIVKEVKNILG